MPEVAPLIVFVYNRPEHTKRLFDAVKNCHLADQTDLYVFCDAVKNSAEVGKVEATRAVVAEVEGFRSVRVVFAERNKGLAASVIEGVADVLSRAGAAIVLEDDLEPSPHFLEFMNECLWKYRDDATIGSVSGFDFPRSQYSGMETREAWANFRPMSWGWATWKDRWSLCDWSIRDLEGYTKDRRAWRRLAKGGGDLQGMLRAHTEGRIDSWYIRWCYAMAKHQLVTIYPPVSLIRNHGHDGSGVHCGVDVVGNKSHSDVAMTRDWILPETNTVPHPRQRSFNHAFWRPLHVRAFSKFVRITMRFVARKG